MAEEVKRINDTNIYRVRKNSKLNQGMFLCKLIMKKHGTVQIEGMGETVSLVAKYGQLLTKNGFAVVQSINSENVDLEGRKQINPKLIITLKKSADFDKLTEDIQLKSE
jgi:hypothetical protein